MSNTLSAQPGSEAASFSDSEPEIGGEAELQMLADALPVLVSYLEADGDTVRYRFVNKIYEEWFPLRREEIMGRLVRDIVGEAAFANVRPYIERALAGERVSYEQFMPYREGARHIKAEYVPRFRATDGKVIGIYALVQDITEARRAEAALRESHEDYRYAAELNPQVAWTALPDGQLDRVAPRWREWTGNSGLGSTYLEGLHPDDRQNTLDIWGHAVATGEPYDILHRVRRQDGEYRWVRSRAWPRRDEEGRIVRWYGSTEDIHDQKTAEDHLKLMVLELNHRVKNNLATVQSIAVQTLRGTETPAQAREAFLQRITALAAAHDILTREQWEGVGVAEVAHGVLDALTAGRDGVTIEGPLVRLDPKATLSFSMAFHELGTNALKYGALSVPEGRVELTWKAQEGELLLRWREHGGPPVKPPTHRGFGSRLLERGVAAELKGDVAIRYDPEGVICLIKAPLPA